MWYNYLEKVIEKYGAVKADIAECISEKEIPMDFHVYEMMVGDGRMELEID